MIVPVPVFNKKCLCCTLKSYGGWGHSLVVQHLPGMGKVLGSSPALQKLKPEEPGSVWVQREAW